MYSVRFQTHNHKLEHNHRNAVENPITETLLKIARCWMRSVKGLAIIACNFLHATQVAAIFIA